jgi:hypothetical protein
MRWVSQFAGAIRLATAKGVSHVLAELPNASDEVLIRAALAEVGPRCRNFAGQDREVAIGFVAHLAREYTARCKKYRDPMAWYAETQRLAQEGAWRTRR